MHCNDVFHSVYLQKYLMKFKKWDKFSVLKILGYGILLEQYEKKTIEKIYDTCKISHTCIRLIAPFGRTWLTLRKRCFINTNVTVLFSVCWHAKLAMLPYCFLCAGMPNWQCYRIVFCVLACQTGNVTVLFSVCRHAKLAMLPYCFLCAVMPNWRSLMFSSLLEQECKATVRRSEWDRNSEAPVTGRRCSVTWRPWYQTSTLSLQRPWFTTSQPS